VIAVDCTCGRWQIDATPAPDRCPQCGARERRERKGPDYIGEPWEELDAPTRMWGVFAAEGDSPRPRAIFATEQEAIDWLNWQESRGDDSSIGNVDYAVCGIDALEGHAWNSINPIPEPKP
jgi:hypothetical protein